MSSFHIYRGEQTPQAINDSRISRAMNVALFGMATVGGEFIVGTVEGLTDINIAPDALMALGFVGGLAMAVGGITRAISLERRVNPVE